MEKFDFHRYFKNIPFNFTIFFGFFFFNNFFHAFQVGGLENHIRCLREMVLFPLMYPQLFEKFNSRPPKGVLFHGPPGTGKTLLARALANESSLQGGRKVSFFMRKGADCLKKWVGESERNIKLLFQQVNKNKLTNVKRKQLYILI